MRQVAEESRERSSWLDRPRVEFAGHVGKKTQRPVTATFTGDTTVHQALETLTKMAGLDFVPVANIIYVTTPEAARQIRTGKRSHTEVLEEIYANPSAPLLKPR
jgi:hypothetical protein